MSSTRRRVALALGSVVAHGLAIAVLAALPQSPALRSSGAGSGDALAPIELVPWRDPASDRAADPTEPPGPTRAIPAGDGDAAAGAAPTARHPRSARRGRQPAAATPEPAPPGPASAGGGAPAVAPLSLSLRGHDAGRDHGEASVPSPRLSSAQARALHGHAGTDAGETDGEGDRAGQPRTLADAGFVRDRRGTYVYREPGGHFTARVGPDGRVHFKDHIVGVSEQGLALPDLYSVVRKAQKRELWSRDKSRLLALTFELRLRIAVDFAERQIDARLAALYRELIELWSADRPAIARRKTLFSRWDDCDERMRVSLPGFEDAADSPIDRLRHDAGAQARARIVEFVRKHLPAGSPDAYGDDELDALNRDRRSEQRFEPYAAR